MEIVITLLTCLGYTLSIILLIGGIGIPLAFLMAKYDDKIEKIIKIIRRKK